MNAPHTLEPELVRWFLLRKEMRERARRTSRSITNRVQQLLERPWANQAEPLLPAYVPSEQPH